MIGLADRQTDRELKAERGRDRASCGREEKFETFCSVLFCSVLFCYSLSLSLVATDPPQLRVGSEGTEDAAPVEQQDHTHSRHAQELA